MIPAPITSACQTLVLALRGRLHFRAERIGEYFVDEDGHRFQVFRAVVVDALPQQPQKPGAVFIPRFHVRGMPWRLNILFSWLPGLFIIGLPGFRSKCWMVDETSGDFAGYYEWDTLEDAHNYASSFAAGFMTRRSRPGSVSFRIFPVQQAPAAPARFRSVA